MNSTDIRQKAKWELETGRFLDFDETIEEYALEDEKHELLMSVPVRIQREYQTHAFTEQQVRKAADIIINGYDDYNEEIQLFAAYQGLRPMDAEDYFRLAADRLGITEAQLKGEEEL